MVGSERISLDDTVVDSVRRGRRDFRHGLTEAGLTHDKLGHFSLLWVKVHDILGYFCILRGVSQVLRFSHHTQEYEPASRVFVTRYKGCPILNTTHIRCPSLLSYDCQKHSALFFQHP